MSAALEYEPGKSLAFRRGVPVGSTVEPAEPVDSDALLVILRNEGERRERAETQGHRSAVYRKGHADDRAAPGDRPRIGGS
jgi:hypothetical protein